MYLQRSPLVVIEQPTWEELEAAGWEKRLWRSRKGLRSRRLISRTISRGRRIMITSGL